MNHNLSMIFIAEDDCNLTESKIQVVLRALKSFKNIDRDILYVGTREGLDRSIGSKIDGVINNVNFAKKRWFSTFGYLIKRRAFPIILKYLDPAHVIIDVFMSKLIIDQKLSGCCLPAHSMLREVPDGIHDTWL